MSQATVTAVVGLLIAAPVASANAVVFQTGDDWRPGAFVSTSVMRDCGSGDLGLGYPAEPAEASLEATWRFDCPTGSIRDSHGDHDATSYGPGRVPGGVLSTRGMSFAGTDQPVVASDPTGLEPDAFTLATWVMPDEGDRNRFLVAKADGPGLGYAMDLTADERLRLHIGDGSTYTILTTSSSLQPGTWHHVVATYDGPAGTADLYLNGTREASHDAVPPIVHDGERLWMGTHPADPARYAFDGRLDEIRFYTDAVSKARAERIGLDEGDGVLDGTYETTIERSTPRAWTHLAASAAIPTWTHARAIVHAIGQGGQVLGADRVILQAGEEVYPLELPSSQTLRVIVRGWSQLSDRTWEIHELNLHHELDHDGDGLATPDELDLGTDPGDPDTDDDRLEDGPEVHDHATDPLDPDTDGDLHADGTEVREGTDPNNPASLPLILTCTSGVQTSPGLTDPVTDPVGPVR